MKVLALTLTFLVLAVISTHSSVIPGMETLIAQQRIIQQLMKQSYSAAASQTDDNNYRITLDQADDCFEKYNKDQAEITEYYNEEYKVCTSEADKAKADVSAENLQKRKDITSRTDKVCSEIDRCDEIVDGLEFFECSYKATSDNYEVLYVVSNDSKERRDELAVIYKQIEYKEQSCLTKAHNRFVASLKKLNDELQNCLLNPSSQPTAKPTESTPESTTTSTTDFTTTKSTTESTENSSQRTTRTTTEGTSENTTESTTESTAESTSESTTESTTASITESTTESITESTTDITTTERSPEEDLGDMMKLMKKVFSRKLDVEI